MTPERRTPEGALMRAGVEAIEQVLEQEGRDRFDAELRVKATGEALGTATWVRPSGWTFALEAGWNTKLRTDGRVALRVKKA